MTETIDVDRIPYHSLVFDRNAFRQLNAADREYFYTYAKRLEDLGYMVPKGRSDKEWAYIDFNEYFDFIDYEKKCRKIHSGNAVRDALKAARKGYYSKFFNPRVFVGDIVAVNTSAPERQGGPMAQHYFQSVSERGGYPLSVEPELPPTQPLLWMRHWGIFRKAPGHRQGEIVVDEELLAYCILRRCSEFLIYSTFLGNWHHLRDGVTYKMHLDLAKSILHQQSIAPDEPGADPALRSSRYLFYARYYTQGDGLLMWKKRMLFRPGYFEFDYPTRPAPPTPPLPLVSLSLSEARTGADYETSGFDQSMGDDRFRLVLFDGATTAPDHRGCFNVFHAFAQPEAWEPVRGALIGASMVDHNHPLLTEALGHNCRRLAPHAEIFARKCESPLSASSPAGRNLGEWLLCLAREMRNPSASEATLTPQLLAPLISGNSHRSLALDLLLQHLAPDAPITDALAIGGGSGILAYFVLSGRAKERFLRVSIVDHLTELHRPTRELFQPLAESGERTVSLTVSAGLPEISFAPNAWDLILFDAAVWRIAEKERPPLFRRAWGSLRENGLLAVNAVVRSDDAATPDAHDRNFSHAPTRHSMIELMAFDRPAGLYRSVHSWQRAEESSAVLAAGYGTDSFLAASKISQ
jgi:predicted O-methyltransferase YrrM